MLCKNVLLAFNFFRRRDRVLNTPTSSIILRSEIFEQIFEQGFNSFMTCPYHIEITNPLTNHYLYDRNLGHERVKFVNCFSKKVLS